MRMVSATWTLAQCHSDGFTDLPKFWSGILALSCQSASLLTPCYAITPAGCFLAKGLVILDDEGSATMSLGFRRYGAIESHRARHGEGLYFTVPQQVPERPVWLFNTTASVTDNSRLACEVQLVPPAALPTEMRTHGSLLKALREPEPLVKAALRSGLTLDLPSLRQCCRENNAGQPVPTGAVGKSGRRSVLKRDWVTLLMSKVFPDLSVDSEEYHKIFEGLAGKQKLLSEDIADEVLEGIRALDPENAEKFSGLRQVAEQVDVQKKVQRELKRNEEAAGRGHLGHKQPLSFHTSGKTGRQLNKYAIRLMPLATAGPNLRQNFVRPQRRCQPAEKALDSEDVAA